MKGGDLSADPAPGIGVRFELVLKTQEGRLNRAGKSFLFDLWRDLDINVYIYTTGDRRKAMAFCLKWGIPYTQVIDVETTLEIPLLCMEAQLSTYYDADKDILANVTARAGHITKAELFDKEELA